MSALVASPVVSIDVHVDDCSGHVFGCAGLDETTEVHMRVERQEG